MKKLKNLFVMLVVGVMAFSLVACNNGEGDGVRSYTYGSPGV